jgi:hypothetical protein
MASRSKRMALSWPRISEKGINRFHLSGVQ